MSAQCTEQQIEKELSSKYQQLKQLICTLRFGNSQQCINAEPVMSKLAIANLIGITRYEVQKYLTSSQDDLPAHAKRRSTFRVTEQQIKILVHPQTLTQWAPYSLRSRCKLYSEEFPGKKLSPFTLRRIYMQHNVRLRIPKISIRLTASQQQRQHKMRMATFKELLELHDLKQEIHYLDEAVFTSKCQSQRLWAPPGSGFKPKLQTRISFEAVAVLGTINCSGVLTHSMVTRKSIDKEKFITFLQELRDKRPESPLYIFLDNLPLHHSIKVKEFCEAKGIVLLFNAIYSSEFNCVERLWKMSKLSFQRELITTKNVHNKKLIQRLVEWSIKNVQAEPLRRHHDSCLRQMQQQLNLKIEDVPNDNTEHKQSTI